MGEHDLTELRDRNPFAGRLGVELLEATPQRVVGTLAWAPDLCTSDGQLLHGGALMGLVDVCGGLCSWLNLKPGATGTTTIESTTHFLRGVRGQLITARSEPLHAGRTTIVLQTDVSDEEGRRCVRAIQSQIVFSSPG